MADIAFAVITVSDTASKDATKDRSGPRLVECVRNSFNNARIHTEILPDEQDQITEKLMQLADTKDEPGPFAVILTTGGTGFAPRDVTPEATKAVLEKECPQLAMVMAMASLKKTKFAALSRGVCGIRKRTLILNFPGSEKAVVECFDTVVEVLPHAVELLNDDLPLVKRSHACIQQRALLVDVINATTPRHICPHKTAIAGNTDDRNSPYPMIAVTDALQMILDTVYGGVSNRYLVSPIELPPFRASIKDGYAVKSTGFAGAKKVIGCIAAGDKINKYELQDDECYKINTGAAVPKWADCVIQVEDTKVLKMNKNGIDEDLVEILVQPTANLDIRPIGSDIQKGEPLFPIVDVSPVVAKSVRASVGVKFKLAVPRIGIISTGSELLDPATDHLIEGKIYDSNTTMLEELLKYFGFQCTRAVIARDDPTDVEETISQLANSVHFIICTGGVSMGDKDHIKPVLIKLGYDIKYGRVNMKPGKPMTYAKRQQGGGFFFALPGNPVSAFVCFHLFVLPALRLACGWEREKCELARLPVTLATGNIPLDPRPEYVRASITSRAGRLYATVTGNQMSSRLQSIVGADVLLHLPGRTESRPAAKAGDIITASVLRYDFISKYED